MRSSSPTESRMGARYQRLPAPPSAHRSHPRSSASPELGGTPLGTVTTMQAEFDDHAPEESLRSMHPRVAPDDEVAIVHGARPTTPNCPDDPAVRAAPAPAGGREYGASRHEGQAGPEDRAPTWGEVSRPDTSL